MLALRTILHPTDFSERSEYALGVACALARDYGARLVVLHVATPPVLAYGEGVLPVDPEGYREELQGTLDRLQVPGDNVRAERRLAEGDPAAEILRAAQELHADLIVMGTHGRTGLGRLLMGSVAEQVVRQAPCPVLTVKTPVPGAPQPSAPPPGGAEASAWQGGIRAPGKGGGGAPGRGGGGPPGRLERFTVGCATAVSAVLPHGSQSRGTPEGEAL